MCEKSIYVVLIKAMTGLGRFARKISRYEYTHIAICLNDEFKDFVTFSRKKHFSPFDAGFMHEKREHYAFGKNQSVKVKIFKLPVSDTTYNAISEYISKVEHDKDYIFNLFSMVTMWVFHGVKIFKAHNCMSFVGKIIELTKLVKLNKKYYKYSIKEMDKLLSDYFYVETDLVKETDDEEYMARVGVFRSIGLFIKVNGKLIYRAIFKSMDREWDE